MPKDLNRRGRLGSSAAAASQTTTGDKPRRQITVYDAVAGRISTRGFIPPVPRAYKNRDTVSTHHTPVPPEDVLFRRRHAPERYEEDDVYFAHEYLEGSQELPGSDLLKAVHSYASDFYGKGLRRRGEVDFGSMDETALICVGVLLEEYMQSVLGDTGDLVFVQAGEEKEGRGGVGPEGANRQKLGVNEDGRSSEDIEEVVKQKSDGGEEASASATVSEDGDEASSSTDCESTDGGGAMKRTKLSSEKDDSSV
ncbi:MAG: hypothetical protein Q9172_003906 [Xanthocarpia lactea]